MNRWLIPSLVTGVVSTIALLTLSPLALSIKATAEPYAAPTNVVTKATPQPHDLPVQRPIPQHNVATLEHEPPAEVAARRPFYPQALSQLLAPQACYGWRAAPGDVQPPQQPAGVVPPDHTAGTVGPHQLPNELATSIRPPAFAVAVATLINQQRQRYGMAPLTLIPALTLAAYGHSLDMAAQSFPVHQGSDGSRGGERMLAAGYQWQAWAEVIGWGFADPDSMVEWWLNDAEHRAVLLSPAFTEFGIGYAAVGTTLWKNYWTVNFGRPATTVISAPLATPTVAGQQALPGLTTGEPQPTLPPEQRPAPAACPLTSPHRYALIPMTGVDLSHPASLHGDLNLAQRGYRAVTAQAQFLDLAGPVDPDAPQLARLFADHQPIHFTSLHQVYDWNWNCRDHGCRGEPLAAPEVTLLGLQTQPGALLSAPARQGSIYQDEQGDDYVAVVLYAESERLTLAYTRDGSVANGYVVHLEQVCVDPNLVQRYGEAEHHGRQQLPGLQHGQPFGTVATTEVYVAIRDRGTFLDPRSRKDWWRGF